MTGRPMTLREIMEAEETDIELDIAADMEREFQTQRKDESMDANQAYDRGYAGNALNAAKGPEVVKETPFSRLAGAVERLRKAHAHVVGIAGKLCGENPPEAATAGQRVSGPGMFGGIEELADSITDMAGEIIDHAERINRRI